MKLFTPEKEKYGRWRYETLQAGIQQLKFYCTKFGVLVKFIISAYYYKSVYFRNSTFFSLELPEMVIT